MQTEKMSVKPFAQPITKFRLYEPMLDLFIIREFPRIIVAGYVKSQFLAESDFKSEIGSRGGPIQSVCLDGNFGI